MKILSQLEFANHTKLAKEIFELLSLCYEESPWTERMILADFLKIGVLYHLAYEENRLVGFLAFQCILDEIEITNLAVAPDFQGQGLATMLMQEFSDFSGTIFLEVRESNYRARRLYEKLAFEEFNRRKDYYSKPVEDALLLRVKAEQMNKYY